MKSGALLAMIVAVARPKKNGTKVASCASITARIVRFFGVFCGIQRAQSPSVQANDTGLLIATSTALTNAGQKPTEPRATLPAYALLNGPANATMPTTNSRLAAHTAILLTHNMKRKPWTQTVSTSTAKRPYAKLSVIQ